MTLHWSTKLALKMTGTILIGYGIACIDFLILNNNIPIELDLLVSNLIVILFVIAFFYRK